MASAATGDAAPGGSPSPKKEENVRIISIEEQAAIFAGLHHKKFGLREVGCLPRFIAQDGETYFSVRNSILLKWWDNPKDFLTFETAAKDIQEPKRDLAKAIYDFLNNYGYINAGVVQNQPCFDGKHVDNPHKKRIIVIGAGMSGVTAARQLKAFGHDVLVLEGRDRIGGRVNTNLDKFESPVDLGASIITGLTGNPLGVVTRQLGTRVHHINLKCPLFFPNGDEIPSEFDDQVWEQYNAILDGADKVRKSMKEDKETAHQLDKYNLLSTMRDIQSSELGDLDERSKHVINWHITNLEYGCATDLSDLSLGNWDQDDEYGFSGDHLFLKDGYSSVIEGLAAGLDIKLSHKIQKILYRGETGVAIHATAIEEDEEVTKEFECDMVLVTVSLGVLKSGMISFTPQLPLWKQAAVNRLGFGLINKLVLEWNEEDIFWRETDMFGHVKDSEQDRGNNYMFWNLKNVTGKPILVSIFSGLAAHEFELTSEKTLVKEAMQHLRKMYGEHIKDPIRTHKTAWKTDPLACGTYSYVKVGASGDDYDALARPVKNRLFFAGEATCRLYPATVPGAHASGLFAAGQIADACNPVKHELFIASDAYSRANHYKFTRSKESKQNRFKRGLRARRLNFTQANPLSSIRSAFMKMKKAKALDSAVLDLMDGKIDIGVLNNNNESKTNFRGKIENVKRTSSNNREKKSTTYEEFIATLTPESNNTRLGTANLPTIGTFEDIASDSEGELDMSETLLTKKARKRRHEEKSRERLRKKINKKMKKHEKKAQQKRKDSSSSNNNEKNNAEKTSSNDIRDSNGNNKSDGEGSGDKDNNGDQDASDPRYYIRSRLRKLCAKYAIHFKLQENNVETIMDKSFEKIMKDWQSKDRKLSVRKWMNTEKRRKCIKALVSKYSKKFAKMK